MKTWIVTVRIVESIEVEADTRGRGNRIAIPEIPYPKFMSECFSAELANIDDE